MASLDRKTRALVELATAIALTRDRDEIRDLILIGLRAGATAAELADVCEEASRLGLPTASVAKDLVARYARADTPN